jgi:hypothetical protein
VSSRETRTVLAGPGAASGSRGASG